MADLYSLAFYRHFLNKPAAWQQLYSEDCGRRYFEQKVPRAEQDAALQLAETDLNWLERDSHHLISILDADYPVSLKEIYQAPPYLFAAGDRSCLGIDNRVAIVGARKASTYGLKQARQIAADLAADDIVIVSGLALGIDAASHEGALEVGGRTIAVLGIGCNQVYPKRNWRLAERIKDAGLIMSEFPTDISAYPANFPRRNRIVTGLALGTVVVEAALRSGSLVSARLAAAEGREVLAVPGLVTNTQARGCHQLIRDGAVLVESAKDIRIALGLDDVGRLHFTSGLEPEQASVLETLADGPHSIDELLAKHTCPVEEMTVTLVSLEVLGLIFCEAGRYQISRADIESR